DRQKAKKWRGCYHVYAPKPDGTTTRIKRNRVIGPCAEMTKAEARDEHRAWLRRFPFPAGGRQGGLRAGSYLRRFRATERGRVGGVHSRHQRFLSGSDQGSAGSQAHRLDQRGAPEAVRQFLTKRTWKTPQGQGQDRGFGQPGEASHPSAVGV